MAFWKKKTKQKGDERYPGSAEEKRALLYDVEKEIDKKRAGDSLREEEEARKGECKGLGRHAGKTWREKRRVASGTENEKKRRHTNEESASERRGERRSVVLTERTRSSTRWVTFLEELRRLKKRRKRGRKTREKKD